MADEVVSGQLTGPMLEVLLAEPVLARIATANPNTHQPHVVPVWYLWDGESLWISSFISTRKNKELQKNPKVSILIDTAESAVDFRSALFEGTAELIREPAEFMVEMTTRIYTRYLGEDGVKGDDPQSWIRDPENTLIKLTPKTIKTWYSAVKKKAPQE